MSPCPRCDQPTETIRRVLSTEAIVLDAHPVLNGDVVIRNGTGHILRAKTPVQPDEARYMHHVCA